MKKNNKKGFTLAELLIVIAIIAVLVAIAIPVFGNAMDKANHTADVANVRAAYSEAVINAMTHKDYTGGTVTIDKSALTAVVDDDVSVDVSTDGHIKVTSNRITTDIEIDGDVKISESSGS